LPDYPALPGSWFGKKGCNKDIGFIHPDKFIKKNFANFPELTNYYRQISVLNKKNLLTFYDNSLKFNPLTQAYFFSTYNVLSNLIYYASNHQIHYFDLRIA